MGKMLTFRDFAKEEELLFVRNRACNEGQRGSRFCQHVLQCRRRMEGYQQGRPTGRPLLLIAPHLSFCPSCRPSSADLVVVPMASGPTVPAPRGPFCPSRGAAKGRLGPTGASRMQADEPADHVWRRFGAPGSASTNAPRASTSLPWPLFGVSALAVGRIRREKLSSC